MNAYVQIEFHSIDDEMKDILIAELSEKGFEGFEEDENNLKAFIPVKDFDEHALIGIISHYKLKFYKTIIEEANWNQLWESGFDPVIVDDFVGIRAEFHAPLKNVMHEIIITPKMSFGTGHHATTFMMIQQMRKIDFKGKAVLDFGTGTGVLAILAEKLGANKVVAIDHDDWCMENALENIYRNNCALIELRKSETAKDNNFFNIILANINKNVILENFSILKNQLSAGGVLLLSGLLQEDKDDIFRKSQAYSLQLLHSTVRDNWLSLNFSH